MLRISYRVIEDFITELKSNKLELRQDIKQLEVARIAI